MAQFTKRKLYVVIVLLVAGVFWLIYATVHQAHLDDSLIQSILSNKTTLALSALHRGADPNTRDYGNGSFWQRIRDRARLLLFFGRTPHNQDTSVSALVLATQRDNSPVVLDLLAQGAIGVNDEADFRPPDRVGAPLARLPLLLGAAGRGDLEIVHALLDHGADANKCDNTNTTPLDHAISRRDSENELDPSQASNEETDRIIALLRKHGALRGRLLPLHHPSKDAVDRQ